MITKKLESETKLWLPIFCSDIGANIFERLLQNPTWTTLGRATMVCKDWRTEIINKYPDFAELSNILSRQILHVHPMMKFWLKIVGDCRNLDERIFFQHWLNEIPYSKLMSRVDIQKLITELEKPSSQIYNVLKDVRYNKQDRFSYLIQDLPDMNPADKYYSSRNTKNDSYLLNMKAAPYLTVVEFQPFLERRKLYNKMNNTVNGAVDFTSRISIPTSVLCMTTSLVCYLATFDNGGKSCLLLAKCFALMGAKAFAILMWLTDRLGNRSMMISLSCLFFLSLKVTFGYYLTKK